MAHVERRSRDRCSKTFARRIDAERFLAAMEHFKSMGAFRGPGSRPSDANGLGAHVAPRRWADGQT